MLHIYAKKANIFRVGHFLFFHCFLPKQRNKRKRKKSISHSHLVSDCDLCDSSNKFTFGFLLLMLLLCSKWNNSLAIILSSSFHHKNLSRNLFHLYELFYLDDLLSGKWSRIIFFLGGESHEFIVFKLKRKEMFFFYLDFEYVHSFSHNCMKSIDFSTRIQTKLNGEPSQCVHQIFLLDSPFIVYVNRNVSTCLACH